MPVQNPGRDHHHGPPRQVQRADPVGRDRLPHHGEGGREQPQRLVDDGGGMNQTRQRILRRQIEPGSLRGDPVLGFRGLRQQRARPEQRHRGRFMPGENHGGDLIAQLRRGEPGPRLRIARRAQQVEHVPGFVTVQGDSEPLRHHRFDQPHPPLAEPRARPVAGGGNGRGEQHVEQMRLGEAFRELIQQPAQRGAVMPCLQREHRPPGDVQRQASHEAQKIGGLVRDLVQRLLRGGEDVAAQQRNDPRRQGGGDGAPLQPPRLALAQQQALAGDRAQDADRGGGAAVARVMLHQHMMDRLGRVEQNRDAPEEMPGHVFVAVRGLRPDGQGVFPDRAQEGAQGQGMRGGHGHGRGEGHRRGRAHQIVFLTVI